MDILILLIKTGDNALHSHFFLLKFVKKLLLELIVMLLFSQDNIIIIVKVKTNFFNIQR